MRNNLSKTFCIKHFISCKTTGVIYLVTCPCGLEYMGKTTRELRCRVGEHLRDIRLKNDKPLPRHMWSHHPSDPLQVHFMGIDLIPRTVRRGNWDKLILQRETQWIHRLDIVHPKGLNEQLNYTCFICTSHFTVVRGHPSSSVFILNAVLFIYLCLYSPRSFSMIRGPFWKSYAATSDLLEHKLYHGLWSILSPGTGSKSVGLWGE